MNRSKKIRNLSKFHAFSEGIFSNIPPCCIAYYNKGIDAVKSRKKIKSAAKLRDYENSDYEYVPCKSCFKRNNIAIIRPGHPEEFNDYEKLLNIYDQLRQSTSERKKLDLQKKFFREYREYIAKYFSWSI